jgi:hypothetical protein
VLSLAEGERCTGGPAQGGYGSDAVWARLRGSSMQARHKRLPGRQIIHQHARKGARLTSPVTVSWAGRSAQ